MVRLWRRFGHRSNRRAPSRNSMRRWTQLWAFITRQQCNHQINSNLAQQLGRFYWSRQGLIVDPPVIFWSRSIEISNWIAWRTFWYTTILIGIIHKITSKEPLFTWTVRFSIASTLAPTWNGLSSFFSTISPSANMIPLWTTGWFRINICRISLGTSLIISASTMKFLKSELIVQY